MKQVRIADLKAQGYDLLRVVQRIDWNMLNQMYINGYFHADIHPANIIVLPNNVIGYVDFGITGTISQYSRRNLVALTLAYTRGDLEGMCEAFFRISVFDSVRTAG